jgi:Na+-translocating ferredoxin:NAD+ oxidoreductase RnfD subunit
MSDTTAPPQPGAGETTSVSPADPKTTAPSALKSRTGPPKMFGMDVRFVPPIFITLILLAGHLSAGFLESPAKTILAIVAAMLAEVVLGRLVTGKWPHLASAYITGISVGILVRAPAFWPFALCSVISITSKYVIRWKGRHLWNPSNFGICMMLLFAKEYFTTLSIQWGNNLLPMVIVWIIGAIIVTRLKRFHITLTYVISFIAFAFLRSAITHDPWQSEIAPITGPMYQLFIFFMITDPKSTVLTKKGQILVAFLIAAMECGLRLLHHFGPSTVDDYSVHAPYYALFIVGPIANMIEIARTPPKQIGPPAAAKAVG